VCANHHTVHLPGTDAPLASLAAARGAPGGAITSHQAPPLLPPEWEMQVPARKTTSHHTPKVRIVIAKCVALRQAPDRVYTVVRSQAT